MPMYEYYCEPCGELFSELRAMSQYQEPAPCPVCGESAPRILATAPGLNTMRAETRKAHQTNERSAHAPRMSHGHQCGAGCQHHHNPKAAEKPGLKQQNGRRPWMLGH